MATAVVTNTSAPSYQTSVVCPSCLRDVWVEYGAEAKLRRDALTTCPHCGNRWPWQAVRVLRGAD